MRVFVLIPFTLSLLGCVPTEFSNLRNKASTMTLIPPGDYAVERFGSVVAAYSGTLNGAFASRVVATAGTDSPFRVFPIMNGKTLSPGTALYDGCDSNAPCMMGAGTSAAGMVSWGARDVCVAVPAPQTGQIRIRCEDNVNMYEDMGGPGGEGFGASAAGVPTDHPFGRAAFGAPGASMGRGAVYRLPDGKAPVELDLSEAPSGVRGLGSALALAVVDSTSVLVATYAPTSPPWVVVAQTDVASDGSVTTRVHACLSDSHPGWGGALALGDLNGDGVPELVVGSDNSQGRLSKVRVYDGSALPPAGTCSSPSNAWPMAVEIGCPTVDGVACDDTSELGAAMAIGDVDGDGIGDLVVGAPMANVEGVHGAGAAFVFVGQSDLTMLQAKVVALRHSHPQADGNLGTAVAVVEGAADASGHRRVEPVLGAPGPSRVYVFTCSGLPGDSPATTGGDVHCQPSGM